MAQAEILYESLPVGRIGVRRDTEEVVLATDFSCFAYMLEEYISYGVVSIAMPSSAPEIPLVESVPPFLRKRIKIVDDGREIEATGRLLFGLRQSFGVSFREGSDRLSFPRDMSHALRNRITRAHRDVRRLALGFNNGLQVELRPDASAANLRSLREKVSEPHCRSILSQLEGLLKQYGSVEFDAQVPSEKTPSGLISVFDRLINDPQYLEYSDSVSRLSVPETRDRALLELREYRRAASSSKALATGWDYLTKPIKAWTGFPLPEAKELATLLSGRTLPSLVNLSEARVSAFKMWQLTGATGDLPWSEGHPLSASDIYWLPPMPSAQPGDPSSGCVLLGESSHEVAHALLQAQEHLRASKP